MVEDRQRKTLMPYLNDFHVHPGYIVLSFGLGVDPVVWAFVVWMN